jgi:outer membrane receptor for ferric coprogen and ferric-rhodotorulic acid
METRRQKFRLWVALLASTGIVSPAWSQTEEAQTEETPAQTQTPAVLDTVEVADDRYISVVSVGGKEPVKPREIPQSVSVITKERIQDLFSNPPVPWETNDDKVNGEVTPYGGLVFDVNRYISLYASYSDVFVPQSSPKFGGGVVEPRVGKQYEIGGKGEFFDGKLTASLAVFDLRDKNRAVSDASNQGFYLNAGEVESKGWEVEVAGSPAPGWDVSASYSPDLTRNTWTIPPTRDCPISRGSPSISSGCGACVVSPMDFPPLSASMRPASR